MNRRSARVMRVHRSLAVVLPKDWCRGNRIELGDLVLVSYNGRVHIRLAPREAKPDG